MKDILQFLNQKGPKTIKTIRNVQHFSKKSKEGLLFNMTRVKTAFLCLSCINNPT